MSNGLLPEVTGNCLDPHFGKFPAGYIKPVQKGLFAGVPLFGSEGDWG